MSVTVLPDLPAPTNPLTAPAGRQIIPVWAITVVYDEDSGIRQAPLCGVIGTQNRFVRVHGGKCTKIIKWAAIGWGGKPPLPSSDTQSANEVLIRRIRSMPVPGKAADGADIVIYAGEYHYGLQTPISDTDTLTGACAPYQSNPNLNVYQLTPSDFSTLFTGPSIPPVGSPQLKRIAPDI